MRKWIVGLLIILIIFVVGGINYNIDVREIVVKDEKIKENINMVLISDLHSIDYGYELIDKLHNIDIDVVVLVGDIVDESYDIKAVYEFLEYIGKNYPTYYVSGNHEFKMLNIHYIKNKLKNYGIQVLEGECQKFKGINMCGIDDIIESRTDQLSKIVKDDSYSVLLAHRPSFIDKYLKYDYDLVLSGHAHGGQIKIPFIIDGLVAPDEWLFPKYFDGLYEFDNGKMIVSKGLAKDKFFVPRLYNRPEIVVVQLRG